MSLSPSLLIVTDRRLVAPDALLARLAAMLDAVPAGAAAVQVREKDLDGGPLHALVVAIVAVARPRGTAVLVNDRLDVALAADADGVHLPERGLDIATARRIATSAGRHDLLVGCSRHDADDAAAAAADGADLVVLGPIWATPSKTGLGAPLGEAALTDARRRMVAAARLVAIGGVESAARAGAARAAGADAVAAIRALWTAEDPAAAARALCGPG